MGGDAINKGIVLPDGLFQAAGYGVGLLQIHIGMDFDVEISFQPPVDLARVNIVRVNALPLRQVMDLIDQRFSGRGGRFNMHQYIHIALWRDATRAGDGRLLYLLAQVMNLFKSIGARRANHHVGKELVASPPLPYPAYLGYALHLRDG